MRDYHSLFSILVAPPIFVLAAKDRPSTTRGLLVSFSFAGGLTSLPSRLRFLVTCLSGKFPSIASVLSFFI